MSGARRLEMIRHTTRTCLWPASVPYPESTDGQGWTA